MGPISKIIDHQQLGSFWHHLGFPTRIQSVMIDNKPVDIKVFQGFFASPRIVCPVKFLGQSLH